MIKLLLLFLTLVFAPAAAPAPVLTVISPSAYQVFQRQGSTGNILIAGYVSNTPSYVVEVSTDGVNWHILLSSDVPFFQGWINGVTQGQYIISVRIAGGGPQRDVLYVGIGDVFVIGGQSNGSGRLVYKQIYAHPTLKAGLFGNNYLWGELKDFTDSISGQIDPVSAGDAGVGSIWPLVATLFMADQGVPVAFIPAAKGGSSIIAWRPTDPFNRATLYGSMVNRIYTAAPGGIKAVLWQQGETDAGQRMAGLMYAQLLNELADELYMDTGAPLVVAQIHFMTALTVPPALQWQIRSGIASATTANEHIIAGPDLSPILSTDAAGQHYTTNAAGQQAAALWWAALENAFYF